MHDDYVPTISQAIIHTTLRLHGKHLGGHVYRVPLHRIWVGMVLLTGWDYYLDNRGKDEGIKDVLITAEIPSTKLDLCLLKMNKSTTRVYMDWAIDALKGRELSAPERLIVLELADRVRCNIEIPL